ncbi:MAG: gamma-glutamylcyclotransferase family protein [Hyphomicrobiaceae bacterium]
MKRLYFAYGSNMLVERLQRRCASAHAYGVAALAGHRLSFSKTGQDGSGKATVHSCDRPGSCVHGVVFDITLSDLGTLDCIEGRGRGYQRIDLTGAVRLAGGQIVDVTTYIAEADYIDPTLAPFDWYLDLVVHGAERAALPLDYCRALAATRALTDPVPTRPTRLEALNVLSAAAGASMQHR